MKLFRITFFRHLQKTGETSYCYGADKDSAIKNWFEYNKDADWHFLYASEVTTEDGEVQFVKETNRVLGEA
ncbi:hypothetical protein [Paenibacillus larvae]|uniref:Uncharacterized protein n=1 Tax=Paenibacillus larvae subsp. larvae TaxID=147375 RepID=A0A6C0QYW6_9BACL|nr:hypothetical protein [Paenibacillus larvae]QHZ53396.1 hypothetical protein ERICV_04345 [Paenibacillus larvae subsp. larvae]